MSHELRTPLTSILAFARMLVSDDELNEKTRSAVAEIETNATLLLNMVNNILTISKTEAHRDNLVLEPVDFVDLISFIKSSLEPVARNKNVTLTARTEPDVPLSLADWEKLRRIVENLVDNAIKYTRTGGAVHVHVRFEQTSATAPTQTGASDARESAKNAATANASSATEHAIEPDASIIVIEVSDNGIGIHPKDHERIFEMYRQARQSSNRRYRGTGLGLAVVKELTELHGGSVQVDSQYQVGSTFTVRIPYVAVSTEEYDEDSAC